MHLSWSPFFISISNSTDFFHIFPLLLLQSFSLGRSKVFQQVKVFSKIFWSSNQVLNLWYKINVWELFSKKQIFNFTNHFLITASWLLKKYSNLQFSEKWCTCTKKSSKIQNYEDLRLLLKIFKWQQFQTINSFKYEENFAKLTPWEHSLMIESKWVFKIPFVSCRHYDVWPKLKAKSLEIRYWLGRSSLVFTPISGKKTIIVRSIHTC